MNELIEVYRQVFELVPIDLCHKINVGIRESHLLYNSRMQRIYIIIEVFENLKTNVMLDALRVP
jgi:hypothetical protein